MAKNKSDGKAKGKGSQFVIRIDKAERAAFVLLCEALDTSAAREIRRFMRDFVTQHGAKRTDKGDPEPAEVIREEVPATVPVVNATEKPESDPPPVKKRAARPKSPQATEQPAP